MVSFHLTPHPPTVDLLPTEMRQQAFHHDIYVYIFSHHLLQPSSFLYTCHTIVIAAAMQITYPYPTFTPKPRKKEAAENHYCLHFAAIYLIFSCIFRTPPLSPPTYAHPL